MREIVKIVAGGILGLVIGSVILWYGFGLDPLDFWADAQQAQPANKVANSPVENGRFADTLGPAQRPTGLFLRSGHPTRIAAWA